MSFQGDSIFWVEVEKVVPNPFQPRRDFDEERLRELAESIRMYGILQPLTVTRKEVSREDGTFYTQYELIAGERRLRASKISGLSQVPVIIRTAEENHEVNEQVKLELAIIENLQREDLNAVDRALAFKQLADQFGLKKTQIAKKMSCSRMHVSNTMRLLQLPEDVLDSIKAGAINEGHARALLMMKDKPEEMHTVYRETLLKKLSVRDVEKIARKIASDKIRKKAPNAELVEMERRFGESLGTRVEITTTNFGGRLVIDYFDLAEVERLLSVVQKEQMALTTETTAGAVSATAESESTQTESDFGGVEEGGGEGAAPAMTGSEETAQGDAGAAPNNSAPVTESELLESLTAATPLDSVVVTESHTETPTAHIDTISVSHEPTAVPPQPISIENAAMPFNTEATPVSSPAEVTPSTYSFTQTTEAVAEQSAAPEATPETTEAESTTATQNKPESEDEGDLYAMRNFSL